MNEKFIILDYILAFLFLVGIIYVYEIRPIPNHPTQAQPLSLIVVRTDAEQEFGLGNRPSLPQDEGMLFVFNTPSSYDIWMKDMLFPIDIISLDQNFSVVHVESNVSPLSYPKIFISPSSTEYIIEANADYAAKNGLVVGDTLDFARQALNKH